MPNLSKAATALRSTLQEVLYYVATVDPTPEDDRNDSFIIGSRWINSDTNKEFVCVDNQPTLAVWNETGSSGSGVAPHIDTVDPTATDDTSSGYIIGQLWIRTDTDTAFVATDVTVSAAVWVAIGGTGAGLVVHTAAVDPTVNDDTPTYDLYTFWRNTVTEDLFIAVDVTDGAAIWTPITGGSGGGTADDITADADDLLTGTTVQSQLTSISSILKGTVAVLHIVSAMGVGYGAYQMLQPTYILGYNTTGL